MPEIKKSLGEGGAYVSSFADEMNSLKSILVAMKDQIDLLITFVNTHTHAAGTVAAPDAPLLAASKITVEK